MLPKNGAMRGPPVLGNETEKKFYYPYFNIYKYDYHFQFLSVDINFLKNLVPVF